MDMKQNIKQEENVMTLIDKDKLYNDMLFEMCGTGYQSRALSVIEMMPQIDAVPVIYSYIKKRENGIAYCSVCGANQHETYDAALEECHYCCSCGAKFNMEE